MVASVGSVNGERISSGCEKFVEKKSLRWESFEIMLYIFSRYAE